VAATARGFADADGDLMRLWPVRYRVKTLVANRIAKSDFANPGVEIAVKKANARFASKSQSSNGPSLP
jgi:hypothetical protein